MPAACDALVACRRAAVFALLLSWAAVASGRSFQPPLPLGELIGTADAIVVGTVADVRDTTFSLEIEIALAGDFEDGALEIAKFAAPVDNPRWSAYARGQRVLLFLAKVPVAPPCRGGSVAAWRIPGRLGEGEIPLEEGYAYFHRRYITPLPPDYYAFHGQTFYLQRLEIETVIDAIRHYRTCFDWSRAVPGAGRPRLSCPLTALCAYRERSPLHDFLLQEADDVRSSRPPAEAGEGQQH